MWRALHRGKLINALRLRVEFDRAVHLFQHAAERSRFLDCHLCIIEKMPPRLDEQRPQRTQLGGRVADHPVVIFVDGSAGRGGVLSIVFAAEEAIIVHRLFACL